MASEYLILDTDAFSYLTARKPQAASYGRLLRGKIPALAFVSIAELRYGAMSAGWGNRRTSELDEAIRKCLLLPFDEQLATVWAQLKLDAPRNGHPFAGSAHANDLWIARPAAPTSEPRS